VTTSDHLTSRDWDTIHKLKPRSFIKSYSALTSFTFHWSLLLEFILSLSNIPLWRSILFHSKEYLYLLLHSFAPSKILFLINGDRVQKGIVHWEKQNNPLCSLPTTVCVTVSSVVYQVALLPSNNGLCNSR